VLFFWIDYIDNTGGIDEKIIESIFNARVTTKKYGSGMGMHLIKLIINKLNASIKVENFEEGAKFSLILD
jgi:nitrogen-specific signal transduction histidine kinase